jgi:glycosyltransferase involved in cell wall biosynthesis
MRILHICAYSWAIGGPPKVIFDHAQIAQQQGHQVTILSPISPDEKPYPTPEGVTLVLCQRTPLISRFFREFSGDLYRYLRKNIQHYDIIHCHGLWHFGALAPFFIDHSVAKVVTIHGVLDPWVYAHNRWKKRLFDILAQKAFLRRADLIQVLSTEEKQDVDRYLGTSQANVVVIPNGIRISDFARLPPKGTFRKQAGLTDDQRIVLFMSRLNVKKGLGILLPAFHDYVRAHPNTVLILAGPDDGYETTVRQFIETHQLGESIRLAGMLTGDDKKAALADADLFVLPSYSEGFSMVVLEAMAVGTPTLVSDKVGFGELIRQRQAAGVLDELTPDQVRAGLEKMLGDDALRKRVSQHATALLRENYDIDIVARRLLDEYGKVMIKKDK